MPCHSQTSVPLVKTVDINSEIMYFPATLHVKSWHHLLALLFLFGYSVHTVMHRSNLLDHRVYKIVSVQFHKGKVKFSQAL